MDNQIYSENARGEAESRIKEIKQLLKLVGTELGKYESLKRFNYGHVGELGRVEEILGEAWEFISETD